jgi:hypothetical protein
MMGTPQFITLVQVDQQRFVTACRHGIIHLTWGRATWRLARDELRLLAALLDSAAAPRSAPPASHGALRVTFHPDAESEVRLGSQTESWALLLAPAEFQQFHEAIRTAVMRLEEILASGMWDKEETDEEEGPPNPLEQLKRSPFSRN